MGLSSKEKDYMSQLICKEKGRGCPKEFGTPQFISLLEIEIKYLIIPSDILTF